MEVEALSRNEDCKQVILGSSQIEEQRSIELLENSARKSKK